MRLFFSVLIIAIFAGQVQSSAMPAHDGACVELFMFSSASNVPIEKRLYGFNQPYPPMIHFGVTDLACRGEVRDLCIGLLRFPGGTLANFYRWHEDRYDFEDLVKYPGLVTEWRRKLFQAFGRGGRKVGFREFLKWVRRDGIVPLLVLNVSTEENYEHIIKALSYSAEMGVRPKYCEIGNELYFRNQGGAKFAAADAYISEAGKLIGMLKQYDGEMRVSVPVTGNRTWPRGRKWDEALASSGLPFDAISIHAYTKIAEIPKGINLQDWLNSAWNRTAEILDYCRALFPGKKLWITEWNVENRPKNDVCKTFFGAIFAAEFFGKLMFEKNVSIACYHRLSGGTHSMLDIVGGRGQRKVLGSHVATYWGMIGRAFQEFEQVCGVEISPVNRGVDLKAVTIPPALYGFLGPEAGAVLVVNKGNALTIQQVYLDHRPVQSLELQSISANSLDGRCTRCVVETQVVPGRSFNLAPYSISFIYFSHRSND